MKKDKKGKHKKGHGFFRGGGSGSSSGSGSD